MSKFTSITNSFKSGKISKKLTHRQDIPELKNGCEEITNFIVGASGGVKRRYGTFDLLRSDTITNNGNLYTIKYSKEYSYIVLIENVDSNIFETVSRSVGTSSKLIRIFDSTGTEKRVWTIANAPISAPWYDTSYDAFNTAITSCFSKLPSSGWQFAQLSRKTIFSHKDGDKMPFVIDLQLSSGVPEFFIYPWCFDKELYTRNALQELTGGTYVPFGGLTVPCSSINTNTLSTATMTTLTGAYTAGTLIQNSGSSDKKMFRTITITNFPSINNLNDYIGCAIVLRNGSNIEGTYIVVKVDLSGLLYPDVKFWVIATCESTAATFSTTKWSFSQWGGSLGFPRTVTTFKGKTVFGGSKGRPNTFWAAATNTNNPNSFQTLMPFKLSQDSSTSDSSGFLYFNSSVLTDLALAAAFNEASSGDIRWIRGRTLLHFGTNLGEHQISFVNNVFALSNMETKKVTSYSSSAPGTVEGNQKIFYVANNNTNLRYISTNDKYSESIDISLSVLNNEYRGIDKLEWAEEPSMLLFKTSDNKLHGVTMNEQSGVSAFCDYEFSFDVIDFMVLEKTIYGSDASSIYILGKENNLYFIAYMPLDSIDRSAILSATPDYQYPYIDRVFVSTGTVNGNNTYTVSNFANKTVGIYNNETYIEVVANGSGTYTNPSEIIGSTVMAGIPYESRLITAQIEEGSKFGSANGLMKRVDRITLYLTKSGSCKVGTNNGSMYTVEKTTLTFDDYSPTVELSNNPDYNVSCMIKSLNGQPLNISSVAFRGATYEGE
jgi:hypothetical protein